MLYNIYSMKDRIISFNAPNIFVNEEAAKRAFKGFCHARQDIAQDLTLWKVGTFDDETGTVIGIVPEMVAMEVNDV